MFDDLKALFCKPSPEVLMMRELDTARRGLLEALTARDYAETLVAYHERRIDRLRSMLEMDVREFK